MSYFPAAVAQGSRDRLLIAEFKDEIQFLKDSSDPQVLAKWKITGLKPADDATAWGMHYIWGVIDAIAKVSGGGMNIELQVSKDDITYTEDDDAAINTSAVAYGRLQGSWFPDPLSGAVLANAGTLFLIIAAYNTNIANTNFLKFFRAAISIVLPMGVKIQRLL